ncbi:MAG: D-alanyl-D-alanine carboxypeptidase/D-alanyl-D-alanine-endopeptidase [Planctomycetes bacterium]|nr:D-alanyl-D-alanine carboxypeptidase/D-alanyl-D-alanine-endopeptidase [Planctomycetota bacterium]
MSPFRLLLHFLMRSCIIFLVLLSCFSVPFQEINAEPANLNGQLNNILKKYSLKNAHCGINVLSLKNNSPLLQYRSDDLFMIASNMKLFTTATALEYLGPNFTYITSVEADGKITDNGILEGNLIIRGSGDPNLSGRFYNGNILAVPNSWLNAIKDSGINKITGDIIADDSIFDRIYINDTWPKNQLHEWYCAPTSGLSFNDNCIDITFVPQNKVNGKVTLLLEPNTSLITIHNECIYTSVNKQHTYSLYRKPGTNDIWVKGKFWTNAPKKKEWISVHNPSLYLATLFKEMLKKSGISVQGTVRLINKNDREATLLKPIKLAKTTSTMEQSVYVTNKQSQNFYAEQILKTLGAHVRGNGSTEDGLQVIRAFMEKLGFDAGKYQIRDGSGLSKENKLSPNMVTTVLSYMHTHKHRKVFYDSLPTSGIDGGLHRRMSSQSYKNKIHAKTGYIAGTSALSGYIDTSKGDMLAFSILINNFKSLHDAKKAQDAICQFLVDSL